MKAFTPVALLVALAGTVSAADEIPKPAPPDQSIVHAHLRMSTEARRKSLMSMLGRRSRTTGKQKQVARRALDNLSPKLLPITAPYEVGQMGQPNGEFEVLDVLEDNKGVLAVTRWKTSSPTFSFGSSGTATTRHERIVLLIGFPHRDLITGKKITLEGDVWVSGTFRYETILGDANTVSVLQPVNIRPFVTDEFLDELGLKRQTENGAP